MNIKKKIPDEVLEQETELMHILEELDNQNPDDDSKSGPYLAS